MPKLEKMCLDCLCNPNNLFFWCNYEREKNYLFKKIHNVICSFVWLWERSSTLEMSCMVTGEDHHIVMPIFETKYGSNKPFKGRSNRELR